MAHESSMQRLMDVLVSARAAADWIPVLQQLNGCFGIMYSCPDGVFLASDRLCSRPIWYTEAGGARHFSTNALTLALVLGQHAINLGALTSYLVYGEPGDSSQSVIEGIRSLGPGEIAHFTPNGRTVTQCWYSFRHRPDKVSTLNDWADRLAERLKIAVDNIESITPRPTLFLSGGIDSRLVAASLCAAEVLPHTITLTDGENIETRVATAVASRLGCPHQMIVRDKEWYLRALPRSAFLSSGTYDFVHAHFYEALGRIGSADASPQVFSGDFGEAYSKLLFAEDCDDRGPCTPDEFYARYDSIRRPLYRPADRLRTMRLFNPAITADAEARLKSLVTDKYITCLGVSDDAGIVYDQYFRWHSAGSNPTWHMHSDLFAAVEVRNLFMDREVHALLEAMPSDVRNRRNLAVRALRRLYPGVAAIANSNTLLPAYWPPRLHAAATKIRPILGKIRRKFVSNSYKTTASWPHYPLLYLSNTAWRSRLTSTLENRELFDSAIFDHDQIAQALAEFLGGDLTRYHDVERLLQFGTIVSQLRGWSSPLRS